MRNKKYKLLRPERLDLPWDDWKGKKFYRIQALRDIPEHGVKAGDLGGYVSDRYILSQKDSSWIGDEAKVYGWVEVKGNAYIGDKAIVTNAKSNVMIDIFGDVRIFENAQVYTAHVSTGTRDRKEHLTYSGKASFYGSARIQSLKEASGNVKIYGSAIIDNSQEINDETEISGSVIIGEGAKVIGKSTISGNVIVGKDCIVRNSVLADDIQIFSYSSILEQKRDGNGTVSLANSDTPESVDSAEGLPKITPSRKVSKIMEMFQEIQSDIATYETDIVKIIKYPVMTDRTDVYTVKMVTALKRAKRLSDRPDDPQFEEAVIALEEKFLAAESNAIKIASTLLTEEGVKKTQKAKDLFRVASNEASSEQEKKVAFIQGFKQLEGVLTVPEVAVDTFRVKIGLKELQA
jgi:serine acetyltransferase